MPARKPSKLGVHVPVGTGLARGAVPYARAIGAEALQVFSSNPRGWAPAPGDRAQDAAFRAGCAQAGLTVFVLAPYLAALDNHPRLGICLDTCHLHAAGHDLSEPGGVRTALNALLRTVGRGRLGLVHVNDSKDPAGSGRDRHERVGTGTIGLAPFAELFRHPATGGVPLILETPGARAEHRADLALLRSLRDG